MLAMVDHANQELLATTTLVIRMLFYALALPYRIFDKLSIYSNREVECYDTVEGAQCGDCPSGFSGDGRTCTVVNGCQNDPCPTGIYTRSVVVFQKKRCTHLNITIIRTWFSQN